MNKMIAIITKLLQGIYLIHSCVYTIEIAKKKTNVSFLNFFTEMMSISGGISSSNSEKSLEAFNNVNVKYLYKQLLTYRNLWICQQRHCFCCCRNRSYNTYIHEKKSSFIIAPNNKEVLDNYISHCHLHFDVMYIKDVLCDSKNIICFMANWIFLLNHYWLLFFFVRL